MRSSITVRLSLPPSVIIPTELPTYASIPSLGSPGRPQEAPGRPGGLPGARQIRQERLRAHLGRDPHPADERALQGARRARHRARVHHRQARAVEGEGRGARRCAREGRGRTPGGVGRDLGIVGPDGREGRRAGLDDRVDVGRREYRALTFSCGRVLNFLCRPIGTP